MTARDMIAQNTNIGIRISVSAFVGTIMIVQNIKNGIKISVNACARITMIVHAINIGTKANASVLTTARDMNAQSISIGTRTGVGVHVEMIMIVLSIKNGIETSVAAFALIAMTVQTSNTGAKRIVSVLTMHATKMLAVVSILTGIH